MMREFKLKKLNKPSTTKIMVSEEIYDQETGQITQTNEWLCNETGLDKKIANLTEEIAKLKEIKTKIKANNFDEEINLTESGRVRPGHVDLATVRLLHEDKYGRHTDKNLIA